MSSFFLSVPPAFCRGFLSPARVVITFNCVATIHFNLSSVVFHALQSRRLFWASSASHRKRKRACGGNESHQQTQQKTSRQGRNQPHFWRFLRTLSDPKLRAVPPAPARRKNAFFCARTDPWRIQPPRGPEGQKVVQKNCANLCTILH